MITFTCPRCATSFPSVAALVDHRMEEPGPCNVFDSLVIPALALPADTPRACTHCDRATTRADFSPNASGREGLDSWCRKCKQAAARARSLAKRQAGGQAPVARPKQAAVAPRAAGWEAAA